MVLCQVFILLWFNRRARRGWLYPFITHLDQSLALCALLWHISAEFRARFTGGGPKAFPLGIPRTSEKVMRLLYTAIQNNDVNARCTARFSHQSLLYRDSFVWHIGSETRLAIYAWTVNTCTFLSQRTNVSLLCYSWFCNVLIYLEPLGLFISHPSKIGKYQS